MIWKPRVTVAALAERDGRFLMVEEQAEGRVVLNQPAGHLDPGESLIQAVVRETLEETAWHFEPEALCGIYRWVHPGLNEAFLRFCFAGRCMSQARDRSLDKEILAVHWLSPAELQAAGDRLRSPLVLRSVADYLAGRRYDLALLVDML